MSWDPSRGDWPANGKRGFRMDWPGVACCAILAAGAVAAYSQTFSVPLIFDDRPAIMGNATIRHWETSFSPPADTTASGRPVVNISLAVNYAISGTDVWSYHVLNLAIHILAGLTLFGTVRRLLAPSAGRDGARIAFCTALIWTLHPLQTESVTYIVQRAESLMGLFYLQTVYWFVRWQDSTLPYRGPGSAANMRAPVSGGEGMRQAGGPGRPRAAYAILSIAFCALGMATKEVMVSAPLVVLLVDRLFFSGSFGEAWRRRMLYYFGIAATWVPLAALVWHTGTIVDFIGHTGHRSEFAGPGSGGPAWRFWATQPEAILRYLKLVVWPHPLVFDYGTQWISTPGHPADAGAILSRLLGPAVAVAALVAVTLYGLARNSLVGLCGFLFFATLAPTSIIPGDRQTAAEHWMYLGLISIVLPIVLGIHRRLGRAAFPACLLLAAALGLVTFRRNQDYSSERAIWSDTVAKCPGNYFARVNLGSVLLNEPGSLGAAISQFEEAELQNPGSAEIHVDLGNALSNEPGRLGEAIRQYEEALRLKPDHFGAHMGLGNALSNVPGRLNDSIAHYEEAVLLKPNFAEGHFNLGNSLARMPGRLDEAIGQYEEALRLKPELAVAHFGLAIALLREPGRSKEAKTHLEEGLRLQPDDAQARRVLANIRASGP